MIGDEKEMTAHNSSVGADDEQSSQFLNNDSIPQSESDYKGIDKDFQNFQQEWLKECDPSYLKTVTMSELYETVFDINLPVVDGILYPGTYLFAGPAKVGKSFLMAQIAYHISTGTPLWGFDVRQGTVLYLALEDDYGRLQRRLFRMFGTESTPSLHLATKAKVLGDGLDEQIRGFIREHPDTRLVIIDVLQRVRDVGGKDYSYASDYEIVAKLKTIADSLGIVLLLVHHTRKQQAEDIFDMISGTNGLLGAADGAFIMSKDNRTGNNATIDVVGRDQPDQRLYLKRDTSSLVWELERQENQLWIEPPDPLLEAVARLLSADCPSWEGSPTELAVALSLDMKPNAVSLRLNIHASRLLKEYGILFKSSRCHDGRRISLTLCEARPA